MRVGEYKNSENLEFVQREGQLGWTESRLATLDPEALGVLREKLITALGADMARGLLTDWGYELGRRDALALGRAFSWENDTQLLLAGPRLQSWLGTSAMEPRRVTLNRQKGLIDLEVLWHRSLEAEQFQTHLGRAEYPVCWTLTGYYAGYSSALLGRSVLAVETTCAGMGADYCTIRLRGRDSTHAGDRSLQWALEPGHVARLMHGELERLRVESSKRLNRLEALREAALDVTAELSLDGAQAKIVSRGRVLLGARYAFLVMFAEPSHGHFLSPGQVASQAPRSYVVVHDGLTQQEAVELDPFPLGTGLFAAVLHDGDTVRVRRIGDDPRSRGMPEHRALSSSFLGVPIRVQGKIYGALYFTNRLDSGEFSLDDEKLCESFAAHAGVALENARLVETLAAERGEMAQAFEREQQITTELHLVRDELERERQLLRSLVDIPASPDIDSALNLILSRLVTLLSADVGAILLNTTGEEPGRLQVRALMEQGRRAEVDAEEAQVTLGSGLSGRVALLKDVLYVRDVAEDPEALDPYMRRPGVRSLLGAPLTVEGRLIGVVEVGSYAVRTFDGPEVRFLRAAANLTALSIEHARLHQEVTRSANLLRAVIEAAPIGLSVTTAPSGKTFLLNGEMRRLEGIARSPAGDAPERALHGEAVSREERTLFDPASGQSEAVRISAAPVFDEQHEVQAAVTVVQGLKLEKEIERLRERFVSLVAHDLRNPLNAAMMHLELLRERLELGPEPQKGPAGAGALQAQFLAESLKTADAIHRSMMRVSDLVSDLLDYSRLEAGQLTINKNDVALRPLVRELLDELRPLLGGRSVEVDIEEGLPPLRADRRRLAQVLTNLLSNALKYTDAGVPMGLRARRSELPEHCAPIGDPQDAGPADPRSWVLLTVWDAGPGIPPEARQRLFDPFYRLSRDQEQREGTGLGLYISRGLCEAHGGHIWIDDVPGANFSMLWPAVE